MTGALWMLVGAIILVLHTEGIRGLKNVSLEVIPSAVQRGARATLRCHYDLEEAPLYSVKWYRGRYEFYRYSPSEIPNSKIFPFAGIHVDLNLSNASQVVLTNVGFSLSGNFSCEVTTDAPSFSTKVVSQHMMVVVFPESRPVIYTEKASYDPGEILRANCSSPPSKPATTLSFVLNNIPAEHAITRQHPAEDLYWSDLFLEIPLQAHHYSGGRLILKCTAAVSTLYQDSVELILSSRTNGDPIPERVRSASASASKVVATFVPLLIYPIIVYCVLR